MLISKETLIELTWAQHADGGYKVVHIEEIDERRWYKIMRNVIEFEGKYYATTFNSARCETAEVEPYEFDGDMVECPEVKPREKVVIEYVPA